VAADAVQSTLSTDAEQALDALCAAREHTLALVAELSDADLERVHSPIMSPLVWDLGHIAAYEDLWLAHRHGGLELLRPELADLYDAFETPRALRGQVETLDPQGAREYLAAVRARTAEVILTRGVGDGVSCEMVARHELQHSETMRQTMAIAGLLSPADRARIDRELGAEEPAGWITLPAGSSALGAPAGGFAYDNERPRHAVELAAFEIARRPVTNASWMRFSEGGGYERREWWSDEGWAWKEEYDITHHPAVAAGRPDAPVCHVSWFEADAFARAHDARLPSEAEWEKAATWSQGREDNGAHDAADSDGERASHSASAGDGHEPLAGVGRVWEWTCSYFDAYPGFEAYPYREYSEVFFAGDYRVLRGGSWATHPRVATPSFRNWDLPQRRQIFAGVRLARSV
jgi:gamma-glutamyl hercynylcysteine S-oxide synthase